MNVRRILLLGVAGSLAVSALFAIYVVVTQSFNETSGRITLTTLAVGFYSLMGLCCTPHLEEHVHKRTFALIGIAVCALGLLFACITNWAATDIWSSRFGIVIQLRLGFFVLAFALAHSSLLLIIKPRSTVVRAAQVTTIVVIAILGMHMLRAIFLPDLRLGVSWQVTAVLGILDALGSIATPLLHVASKT